MNIVHKTGINHRKIYLFGSVSLSCVCTDQCFCLSKVLFFLFGFFYFSIFLFFVHISIRIDINIFLLYNFELNNTTAFCVKKYVGVTWLPDWNLQTIWLFLFLFFCSKILSYFVLFWITNKLHRQAFKIEHALKKCVKLNCKQNGKNIYK